MTGSRWGRSRRLNGAVVALGIWEHEPQAVPARLQERCLLGSEHSPHRCRRLLLTKYLKWGAVETQHLL